MKSLARWLPLLLLLNGCVNVAKPIAVKTGEPKLVSNKSYTIGVARTSFVGEPIFRVKCYTVVESQREVKATNDFVVSGGLSEGTVNFNGTAGQLFGIVGTIGSDLRAIKFPGARYVFGITKDGKFCGVAASFDFMRAPITGINVYKIDPESTVFLTETFQQALDGYPFKNHELLFSGTSSDEFKLLYREYTVTDLARPAFSQEVTYPLNSKSIRFRGYLIELLDVKPDSVTYIVIEEE